MFNRILLFILFASVVLLSVSYCNETSPEDDDDDDAGGEIQCPSHVYFRKATLNATIICTSNISSNSSQLKWQIDGVELSPGQTIGIFSFPNLINEEAQVKLIIAKVNFNKKIVKLLEIEGNGTENVVAEVRIYEKGQGKMAFFWWDYTIFGIVLLISALIGIYFGFVGQGQNSQEEYMLGGRSMGWFPVSMSLLASFMSAITILGTPSEIYTFGTQYLMIIFAFPLTMLVSTQIFLPLFYNLGLTSTYEYLELRFSKVTRVLNAVVFIFQMLIYMSMVVYLPSLAMQAVIGLNFWASALSTTIVCIFYTSLGGMKATMWTDAFQVIMMMIGLLAIFIQGLIREGGFGQIWETNKENGRIEFFEMNPDPRFRNSFWTVTLGGSLTWLFTYGVNQAQVQRVLSARSLKTAKLTFAINAPGLMLLTLFSGICGLFIYNRYGDCDPVKSGAITKRDQLLIYYVMDVVAEDLPGLPGLFMATLFSASLSTISSGLNGLAAVTCKDLGLSGYLKRRAYTEGAVTWAAKLISIAYGVVVVLFLFVIQYLPGILGAALALFGALGGPILGVFVAGIILPWVNSIGVTIGAIVAWALTIWLTLGAKFSPNVALAQPLPSQSTLYCPFDSSDLSSSNSSFVAQFVPFRETDFDKLEGIENIYSISYLYMSVIGVLVPGLVGLLISACTGFTKGRVLQANYFNPTMYRFARRFKLDTWETPEVEKGFITNIDEL